MLLVLSAGSGALAGIAKEFGDAWGLWPFCPCQASGRDLAADAAGVALAAACLVCWQHTALHQARGLPTTDVRAVGV